MRPAHLRQVGDGQLRGSGRGSGGRQRLHVVCGRRRSVGRDGARVHRLEFAVRTGTTRRRRRRRTDARTLRADARRDAAPPAERALEQPTPSATAHDDGGRRRRRHDDARNPRNAPAERGESKFGR